MSEIGIPKDSLVYYKKRPARVLKSGERLEIELDDRNQVKVRPKDVALLHPGPLLDLGKLLIIADAGDPTLAWEIVNEGGASTTLAELAELAFGSYTPATAWTAWRWVEDGLYFQGTPEAIIARPAETIQRDAEARQARQSDALKREEFLRRAAKGEVSAEGDARFLQEIRDLALGRRKDSRLLRELGRSERQENAHALLLDWGVWDENVDPHPARVGVPLHSPEIELPALPDDPRRDLTGLAAFAIDDRHNQDPDDAISLEECRLDENGNFAGGRIWVHVADVAALVAPDSPPDLEARLRGATLYLPEGPVQMLPPEAVPALGLGLHEISPALSFGIRLDAGAHIKEVQIEPSRVRVQRWTYEAAEEQIETEPLHSLDCIARAYHARRQAEGAFLLDLPEATVRVIDGQVSIEPVLRLRSRDLVREAMLMAGEAAALFAKQNNIPVPYVTQEGAAEDHNREPVRGAATGEATTLAQRFALRRKLRRSQVSSRPAPHAGVGLPAYARATSPLRRYLDLVAHQQFRLFIQDKAPLNEAALFERLGDNEAITAAVALAESLARRHWTLVYLLQNPGWRGEGVLVETTGTRGIVLVPELALEAPLHLPKELPLDTRLMLSVRDIQLPELEVHFNIL